jgi:hypothetical protein
MDSTVDITKDELRIILERCNSTTEGPWVSFVEGRDHTSGSDFIKTAKSDIELSGATVADQDFIAAAKADIPRLVSIIANHYGWVL